MFTIGIKGTKGLKTQRTCNLAASPGKLCRSSSSPRFHRVSMGSLPQGKLYNSLLPLRPSSSSQSLLLKFEGLTANWKRKPVLLTH